MDQQGKSRKRVVKDNDAKAALLMNIDIPCKQKAITSGEEKTELVTKSTRMYALLDASTKDVMSISIISDDFVRITWRYKEGIERSRFQHCTGC
jgi:hypothetical protein